MPRLLAFLACEKVIIADDNQASIMGLLQGFELSAAPPANQTVVLPMQWTVFTLWEKEPDDKASQLTQRFELLAPDGTSLLQAKTETAVISEADEGKVFHRVVARLKGFPVRGATTHTLRLLLKTGDGEYAEKSKFSIPLIIKGT